MKCVSKEQYECIKLTKENLKEFLRIVEPYLDSKYVFKLNDNDKYCLVKRFGEKKYYFYKCLSTLDSNLQNVVCMDQLYP